MHVIDGTFQSPAASRAAGPARARQTPALAKYVTARFWCVKHDAHGMMADWGEAAAAEAGPACGHLTPAWQWILKQTWFWS